MENKSKNARRKAARKAALQASTCAVQCENHHPLPRVTPQEAEVWYDVKRAQGGSTLVVGAEHCDQCKLPPPNSLAAKTSAHATQLYVPGQTKVTVHNVLHADPRGFLFVTSFCGRVTAVRTEPGVATQVTVCLMDARAAWPINDAQARVFFKKTEHLRLIMLDEHTPVVIFTLDHAVLGEEVHPLVILGVKCKENKCSAPCAFHALRDPVLVK